MGWKSISVSERVYRELERLRKNFSEATQREYSLNDVIFELIKGYEVV